jgi:gp16 family phage-associated protein
MSRARDIPNKGVLTKDQVVAKFSASGLSFAQFARDNRFTLSLVYSVLEGRVQGLRGQSHNIAVALGMKHGVRTDTSPRHGRQAPRAERAAA